MYIQFEETKGSVFVVRADQVTGFRAYENGNLWFVNVFTAISGDNPSRGNGFEKEAYALGYIQEKLEEIAYAKAKDNS
jgi:hypothetical protein